MTASAIRRTNQSPPAAQELAALSRDYVRIERAIRYLAEPAEPRPGLEDAARHVGLSEFHFQRLFSRWVGISPKRFLQFLAKEQVKEVLARSENLLAATYDSGLSSPSRLHDLILSTEAMTPGQLKEGGRGLLIRYGVHPTPFGEALLAITDEGICGFRFLQGESRRELIESEIVRRWPEAELRHDPAPVAKLMRRVFPRARLTGEPLHLVVRGTNFQIKVWEALLRIPPGALVSYAGLAEAVGAPGGARAVGRAIAENPVLYLIPCHRVVRGLGVLGEYQGGSTRKQLMLGWEAAHHAREELKLSS